MARRSRANGKPKPPGKHRLCRCGCGLETGDRHHRWVAGHYTARVRSERWQQTRGGAVMQRRAAGFKAELERIGQRLTKEDLLALFQDIYNRAYRTGYDAGRASALRLREAA